MRIQLRLSHEARVILEEQKLEHLKKDKAVTSGEITDMLFENFKTKLHNINWNYVRDAPQFDGILADYVSINPTTLNLSDETIDIMENFRQYFNCDLNMKRTVYRSYIIRIVLKAFKLEQNGINIYK